MIILTKKFKLLLNKVLVLLPTKQRFSFIYRTGLWFSNKESQVGAGYSRDRWVLGVPGRNGLEFWHPNSCDQIRLKSLGIPPTIRFK